MAQHHKDYSHIVGQKFGKFTVLYLHPREMRKKAEAHVVCDCGTHKDVQIVDMVRGKVRSCGCPSHVPYKNTTENRSWSGMKNRCYNPKNHAFHRYGGRGITVCDRWRESFSAFLDDVGLKPAPNMSLDRIDNSRGYEPGNVRWADDRTQGNNKRNTHLVTINGVTKGRAEWCRDLGIPRSTVSARMSKGMSAMDALLMLPIQDV